MTTRPPTQPAHAGAPELGSLLTPDVLTPQPAPARPGAGQTLRDNWQAIGQAARTPRGKRFLAVMAGVIAAGLTIWALVTYWPRAIPNYAEDDIGDVLDYTLLTDDFNQLPVDKRLKLIKDLVERLKSMSAGDSAMMAAFAAGITGKARDQLRTNAERLAVDVWDSFADKYDDVPVADREQYLDKSFMDFTRMMEEVAGVETNTPPEKRLEDARRQAKRDADEARRNLGPIPERAGEMMKMLRDRGEKVADPQQRARMTRFTRDMVRHLRGQDVATGKPKPEPSPPGQPPEATPPGGG